MQKCHMALLILLTFKSHLIQYEIKCSLVQNEDEAEKWMTPIDLMYTIGNEF